MSEEHTETAASMFGEQHSETPARASDAQASEAPARDEDSRDGGGNRTEDDAPAHEAAPMGGLGDGGANGTKDSPEIEATPTATTKPTRKPKKTQMAKKTQDTGEKERKVGYGSPPVEFRFRKGVCPNRAGRPPGALGFRRIFVLACRANKTTPSVLLEDSLRIDIALMMAGDEDARARVRKYMEKYFKDDDEEDGGDDAESGQAPPDEGGTPSDSGEDGLAVAVPDLPATEESSAPDKSSAADAPAPEAGDTSPDAHEWEPRAKMDGEVPAHEAGRDGIDGSLQPQLLDAASDGRVERVLAFEPELSDVNENRGDRASNGGDDRDDGGREPEPNDRPVVRINLRRTIPRRS